MFREQCLEDGIFDPGLFCFKFNGPGFNYEIVIGLYTGFVCSIKGPYKYGEMPDLKVAKEEGLVDTLAANNEKCIADGTYRNVVFVNSGPGLPRELLDLIKVVKARHESFNSRMKRCAMFRELRGFRHATWVHEICFHSIANITEIEIELESPLFEIGQQLEAFDAFYRRHIG